MAANDSKQNWKRMSFKGNKVWAQTCDNDQLRIENDKVLIKYNLKQDYEYKVSPDSLHPEELAIPAGTKDKRKSLTQKKKSNQNINKDAVGEVIPDHCIKIYTDGASSGNPGPAGIGILFMFEDKQRQISRYIGQGTNNIAELTAIKVALEELKRNDLPVCIFSDSSYAIGLLTQGWKPKKNQALVADIKQLMKPFSKLQLIKVKGHSGVKENEIADYLATSAIKKGLE